MFLRRFIYVTAKRVVKDADPYNGKLGICRGGRPRPPGSSAFSFLETSGEFGKLYPGSPGGLPLREKHPVPKETNLDVFNLFHKFLVAIQ